MRLSSTDTPDQTANAGNGEPHEPSKRSGQTPYFEFLKDTLRNERLCQEEFEAIKLRREKAWLNPTGAVGPQETKKTDHSWDLVGLAISGGEIRSATFALGVLQGLASMKLLHCVDYLSTVSGGGFIGSWLIAWIKRAKNMDVVVDKLNPSWADHHSCSAEGKISTKSSPALEPVIDLSIPKEENHAVTRSHAIP